MPPNEDAKRVHGPRQPATPGGSGRSNGREHNPGLVEELSHIARALELLGNADGVSRSGMALGAIEYLSTQIQDAGERIAGAILELAAATDRAHQQPKG